MTDNVTKPHVVQPTTNETTGEDILKAALDEHLSHVLIIAEDSDGNPYVAGNVNNAVAVFMMEQAKMDILLG